MNVFGPYSYRHPARNALAWEDLQPGMKIQHVETRDYIDDGQCRVVHPPHILEEATVVEVGKDEEGTAVALLCKPDGTHQMITIDEWGFSPVVKNGQRIHPDRYCVKKA